jgi:putative peptide zinc metalloprotease protein
LPRLADGVELIGEYEGSGFTEPPFLLRRPDGQMIQVSRLLYLVAECADGRCDLGAIATKVSERFGRPVSADNVRFLVEEKLRPLGVLAGPDGRAPELERPDPLLALKFRAALLPEGVVRAITTLFRPLFFPPVLVAVLGGLAVLDVWLSGFHGVAQSGRQLLYRPALLLLVLGLLVLSAAFHECGHATACRYGGAKPGAMGAGIYLVWPAFYTDVTDAYRLGKGGRLRTDLGGIYFNVVFTLGTAAVYFATAFEPLLVVIVLQHVEIVRQLLPFLRLDGYYVVSDLTGVPDMFARIKPTLKSLLPWKQEDESVAALKPSARVATTAYVLTLVPILALMFGFAVISAPRIVATAWDSFFVQLDKVSVAFGRGEAASGLAAIFQMVALALPVGGMAMSLGRSGKRLATGTWSVTRGSPAARGMLVVASAAAAAFALFTLWPNGEYRPIQPGERGTVQGGVAALAEVESGRPALTEERERQLGGAPTRRSQETDSDDEGGNGGKAEQTPSPAGSQTDTTQNAPEQQSEQGEQGEQDEQGDQGETTPGAETETSSTATTPTQPAETTQTSTTATTPETTTTP